MPDRGGGGLRGGFKGNSKAPAGKREWVVLCVLRDGSSAVRSSRRQQGKAERGLAMCLTVGRRSRTWPAQRQLAGQLVMNGGAGQQHGWGISSNRF
jgi:hypothetical protein